MTTAFDLAYVRREEEPVLAPPRGQAGQLGWLRRNLFSSMTNTILTALAILFIAWIVPPLIRWAFIDAVWVGKGREACVADRTGACWAFVGAKFGQFMYGRYPADERWRVNLTAILLVAGLIPMAIPRTPFKRENAIYLLALFPVIAFVLLTGGHVAIPFAGLVGLIVGACFLTGLIAAGAVGDRRPTLAALVPLLSLAVGLFAFALMEGTEELQIAGWRGALAASRFVVTLSAAVALLAALVAVFGTRDHPSARRIATVWIVVAVLEVVYFAVAIDFGLTPVETPLWGGLLVTLVVAIVGMVSSLPLGVLLALGRRSRMPVVRLMSVVFIEFWRGVPLITVLFMASVMLPVFLPPGVTFDKLLRALIGVALFSSAYMAEVVRGGLQAIPRGQYEAARAMGLQYGPMMRLVILPQALKIVIPGIVNSFISLFKDTSLVLIIGIFDLLGIVQQGFVDSNWASPATPATGYVFAAAVFWVFCFGMSRYSIYTERRLHTGHRR